MEERLFEIDPTREVEWQVDAMFSPLYATTDKKHHALIETVEREMINALMSALRSEPINPLPINPDNWPFSSKKRLLIYLQDEQQRKAWEVESGKEN